MTRQVLIVTANGTEVLYEIFTDADGVEVMAPIYWRTQDGTN